MPIPIPRLLPKWKLDAAIKADIPIKTANQRPYVSVIACRIDLSCNTPNLAPIEVYTAIDIAAKTITQRNA